MASGVTGVARSAARAASTPMDVESSSYDATARMPLPAEAPRAAAMALRSSRAYGTYAPQARRPRTPPLPDVLLQELDRALHRLVGARLVVRGALVAVQAVAGRVDVLLEVRVLLLDLLPVLLRDGGIGLAPVEDHRGLRLLRRGVRDAAAVVRDRGGDAVDPRGREPRHGAAEAIPDDADLEARLLRLLHRGAHVLHRIVDRQLAAHGAAALDVGLLVARFEPALDPVEQRRRDREVALLGEAIGDALDVVVDAEDLLDHDQRAARLRGRRGFVGGELVSVLGGQVDRLTHGLSSVAGYDAACPSRWQRRPRPCGSTTSACASPSGASPPAPTPAITATSTRTSSIRTVA